MTGEETIAKFNVRVLDFAKESFALGEKISKAKMVQKVLRSLSVRFNMKVTAIKEANDVTSMKLDELFGSLQKYLSYLFRIKAKKKKGGVAFQGRFRKFKNKFYKKAGRNGTQGNRDNNNSNF
ncbi:Receptor-like protein 12 [Cucumis melo var. makuwa]|uniref:Receptor-like protein 12 n=1 Tax=Cucumis melo var. makuwa TaxID=1194695 RepID=A0A5D3DVM1_CUCMM|nr:Receptor-like protein 12 [Cucumis melo var. makuwa]